MINIKTFGSAKIISDKGLSSSINYVNSRDMVTKIADPIGYAKAKFSKDNNVVFMKSPSSAPFNDHGFLESENYKAALFSEKKKFIQTHGKPE